jgi:hypothetical protein
MLALENGAVKEHLTDHRWAQDVSLTFADDVTTASKRGGFGQAGGPSAGVNRPPARLAPRFSRHSRGVPPARYGGRYAI